MKKLSIVLMTALLALALASTGVKHYLLSSDYTITQTRENGSEIEIILKGSDIMRMFRQDEGALAVYLKLLDSSL